MVSCIRLPSTLITPITLGNALRECRQKLAQSNKINENLVFLEANCLVANCSKIRRSREQLLIDSSVKLSSDEHHKLLQDTNRRLAGEPLAYVLGYKEFWKHEFLVTKDTLIPRSATETLLSAALEVSSLPKAPRVLDIGVGSGCILLSYLSENHSAIGCGIDVSEPALKIARKNATQLGLDERCSLFLKDITSPTFSTDPAFQDGFDLIFSNPPYISSQEVPLMDPAVVDYEPHPALFASHNGLAIYRSIASSVSTSVLRKGGYLILEIGYQQASSVPNLFSTSLQLCTILKDLEGFDRCVVFKK